MPKLRIRRPSPALVVATAACVIATGGVAFSAPAGPDGTIHACYDAQAYANDGSMIMVVPSADVCARPGSDFPDHFTFNATGPAGATGATGAAGAPGSPGATGAPGPKGEEGEKVEAISPKDVKELQKAFKETESAEKKMKEELGDYKQADTSKEKQRALEALTKQIVEMTKQLQDQQAKQMQTLIRRG